MGGSKLGAGGAEGTLFGNNWKGERTLDEAGRGGVCGLRRRSLGPGPGARWVGRGMGVARRGLKGRGPKGAGRSGSKAGS